MQNVKDKAQFRNDRQLMKNDNQNAPILRPSALGLAKVLSSVRPGIGNEDGLDICVEQLNSEHQMLRSYHNLSFLQAAININTQTT